MIIIILRIGACDWVMKLFKRSALVMNQTVIKLIWNLYGNSSVSVTCLYKYLLGNWRTVAAATYVVAIFAALLPSSARTSASDHIQRHYVMHVTVTDASVILSNYQLRFCLALCRSSNAVLRHDNLRGLDILAPSTMSLRLYLPLCDFPTIVLPWSPEVAPQETGNSMQYWCCTHT